MIILDSGDAIRFDSPQTFERLRPSVTADPYDPDSQGVPDWGNPLVVSFAGFLARSSSTIVSDAVREQVATTAVLTVASPGVDIQVGDRIRQGGKLWQVTGRPARDINPFTGWQPTLEVLLAEYEG